MFEVTTLGQPLEVIKTTMAANRTDSFAGAMRRIWGRGGILGCKFLYRGAKTITLNLLYRLPRSHSLGLD